MEKTRSFKKGYPWRNMKIDHFKILIGNFLTYRDLKPVCVEKQRAANSNDLHHALSYQGTSSCY